MRPKPNILGFDTSAAHVAAAFYSDGQIQAAHFEEMKKGQAETLFPALENMLPADGWQGLDAIAVGIGPGNFTGVRISVSAARGLALALKIPAIGISNFELAAFKHSGPTVVSLPTVRDQILAQRMVDGRAVADPYVFATDSDLGKTLLPCPSEKIAERLCLIAADRMTEDHTAPAPLYVRPADAALPSEAPVKILP